MESLSTYVRSKLLHEHGADDGIGKVDLKVKEAMSDYDKLAAIGRTVDADLRAAVMKMLGAAMALLNPQAVMGACTVKETIKTLQTCCKTAKIMKVRSRGLWLQLIMKER